VEDRPEEDPVAEPLARYVEAEARRRFLDPHAAPDPELTAAGWERRFITDLKRVPEVLELYETLGYETRAEPLRPDELADDCQDCQLATFGFRSIYTRRVGTVTRETMNPEG